MSAKSLGQLAVDRDIAPPGQSVRTATEVLVEAAPSEALAAYTALIGIVLAADIGSTYSAFRWTAYGVFVALAMLAPLVIYRRGLATRGDEDRGKDTRHLPVPECLTAGFAAAAWGLVMPGAPLSLVLRGVGLTFGISAIALGAAVVLGFATQLLGSANNLNRPGQAPPPGPAPVVVGAPAQPAQAPAPVPPMAPPAPPNGAEPARAGG